MNVNDMEADVLGRRVFAGNMDAVSVTTLGVGYNATSRFWHKDVMHAAQMANGACYEGH